MNDLQKKMLIGITAVFTACLLVYGIVGFSTLMMADDYCYFSMLNGEYGYIGSQINAYWHTTHIAGNRFAANLFSVTASLLTHHYVKFSPLVTLLTLLAAVFFVFTQVMRLLHKKVRYLLAALFASFFCAMLCYIAPSRFQNIYWFSGVIAYTTPLIIFSFAVALLLFYQQRQARTVWPCIILFLLGLFSSGFSETSSAALVTFAFLLNLLLYFLQANDGNKWQRRFFLIGLLCGMFLLVISPSAQSRVSGMDSTAGVSQINHPIFILLKSFEFGADFVLDRFKSYWMPLSVNLFGFSAIGGLYFANKAKLTTRQFALSSLLILGISYVTISGSAAPQVYAFSAYFNTRSQMIPSFFFLLGLSTFAFLLGAYLTRWYRSPWLQSAILLFAAVYLIRGGLIAFADREELSQRSEIWQTRHTSIIESAEDDSNPPVARIDSLETIGDIFPGCFEDFYSIESVNFID